jgi:hypothetical protein
MELKFRALGRREFTKEIKAENIQEFIRNYGEETAWLILQDGLNLFLRKAVNKSKEGLEEPEEFIKEIKIEKKRRVKTEKVIANIEGFSQKIRETLKAEEIQQLKRMI